MNEPMMSSHGGISDGPVMPTGDAHHQQHMSGAAGGGENLTNPFASTTLQNLSTAGNNSIGQNTQSQQAGGQPTITSGAGDVMIPGNLPQNTAALPVGLTLSDVQTALVKWFDPTKNFGFLIIREGDMQGEEIFVHGIDVVGNPIRDNDSVECQVQTAPNVRRRCVNVTGGTGTVGDMTRPPKNNSQVLQIAAQSIKQRGQLTESDRVILGNKLAESGARLRKDSRVGYRSLGDLRNRALRRLRQDSRSSSSSRSRSRRGGGRGRGRGRHHGDRSRNRGGGHYNTHGNLDRQGGGRAGTTSVTATATGVALGSSDVGVDVGERGRKGGDSRRRNDSRRRDDSRRRGRR